MSVMPGGSRDLPIAVNGYAVCSDFFPMFEVPFRYGARWSAQDDESRGSEVVISDQLNQRLFGGADSVGRTISLNGHDYRVAGVTDHWDLRPRFFDLFRTAGFDDAPDFYMLFTRPLDFQLPPGRRHTYHDKLPFTTSHRWWPSNFLAAPPWVEP